MRFFIESLIFYTFAKNVFIVELAGYIKNLLYNNDQVIIPGFGALKTKYKPAEVNTSEHIVTPPSKYLVFDNSLATADELLVIFIASQKSISQVAACEYVMDQVKLLKSRLDSGETVLFEGIGRFYRENGIICFECEQDANFLIESYGLSKIGFKPAVNDIPPKQDQVVRQPVPKKKSYTFVILSIVLVFVAGGGTAIYFYYPQISKIFRRDPQQAVILPSSKVDTIAVSAKDTTNKVESFYDSTTDKKSALAIPSDQTPPQTKASFYIIAGSFKTHERASVLVKQLTGEGHVAKIIQFDGEIFRVSLGEYNVKEQALAELQKIRSLKGKDAVWLLSK